MDNSKDQRPPRGSVRQEVFLPDITVAAIVLRGERLLLIEEEVHGERVINQPAGHLEPGEALVDAMVRETFEESGWRVQPTALVGIYQWTRPRDGRQFVRIAYAASAAEQSPAQPADPGVVSVLWLSPEELRSCSARHRSPLVLAAADDFLAGRRLPLAATRWLH